MPWWLVSSWLDFNSIKVRLKPTPVRTVRDCPVFQFHKGTIKTGLHRDQHERIYLSFLIKFQFHKGTIKTISINEQINTNLVFQFHKGTIKTSNW